MKNAKSAARKSLKKSAKLAATPEAGSDYISLQTYHKDDLALLSPKLVSKFFALFHSTRELTRQHNAIIDTKATLGYSNAIAMQQAAAVLEVEIFSRCNRINRFLKGEFNNEFEARTSRKAAKVPKKAKKGRKPGRPRGSKNKSLSK